jgi:hypothetical protein
LDEDASKCESESKSQPISAFCLSIIDE